MGEYAKFGGREVKIGTCENMYYLRANQRHAVHGGDVTGPDYWLGARFRFPWPDEDTVSPGGFENYDRAVSIDGVPLYADLEHCSVQFVAQAGYNVCLPCPESLPTNGRGIDFHGATVHRNGFHGRVLLCQQRLLEDGRLVPVFRCGGCESRWRIEEPAEIEAAVVAVRSMADKLDAGRAAWWHKIADRIMEGAAVPV